MIISLKGSFVLLSNRKCASTSLVHTLEPYATLLAKEPVLRHTNFSGYKKYVEPWLAGLGRVRLDRFRVYCLFREPTEWLFSWYAFRQRKDVSPEVIKGHGEYTGHITWRDFLEAYFSPTRPSYARVGRQIDFVTVNGIVGDDLKIFPYEHIHRLVRELSHRLEVELVLATHNISPKISEEVRATDYQRCRSLLKEEYALYDSTVQRATLDDS